MSLSQSAVLERPAGVPLSARAIGVIVGATLGNFLCLTQAVMSVFGVMLVPIAHEFGWSRAQVAGGFTAMSLASAAMLPFAGRLADRFGVRRVLVVGAAAYGLCILLLSLAPPQPILFYGLFALIGAVGAVPGNMLLSKLLAQWFDKDRGFWLGLTGGVGNGLGAIVMPGAAALLLHALGWRGAFIGVGAAVLLVGLPVAILTLHSPSRRLDAGDERELDGMTLGQALRSPMFWLVLTSVPLGGGALTGVFATMMPILTDRGLGLAQAAGVIAAFALICVLWEPLVGFLLDRRDRPRIAAPFFLCAAAGLMVLAHAHQPQTLTLGAVLTGMGLGSEFSVMPLLLSRYFGLRSMGAITGIAYATALLSNAIAPLALNRVFDVTGSYALGLNVVAVMMLGVALAFALMRRFPRSL